MTDPGRGNSETPLHLDAHHHPFLRSGYRRALNDVLVALGEGYNPQNPSAMHPADYVTLRFKLPGHEGLRDV
jgi:hypothetical protein